jgi:outer membrane protein OmpA-like peptidoglycan-associated protein
MRKYIATLLAVLLTAAPALFAQTVDEHAKTKKGAVIGGIAGTIAGAVIGNNRGHHSAKRGAVVGAVAGTAAGAIVGAMMDKQERELRQIQGVDVTRTSPGELNVRVQNEVLFDFGSSALRSSSREALRQMADVFQKYPNTILSVQGHTDSIGTAAYNQRLSVRRADAVADYLQTLGVNNNRLETLGFGESQPRATNSTAAGRQMNRRVEIHVHANA